MAVLAALTAGVGIGGAAVVRDDEVALRSVFFAGWLLLGLTLVTALHLVGLLIGYTRGRAMDIVLREADGGADNADE